jgi:hypothetical protein
LTKALSPTFAILFEVLEYELRVDDKVDNELRVDL